MHDNVRIASNINHTGKRRVCVCMYEESVEDEEILRGKLVVIWWVDF